MNELLHDLLAELDAPQHHYDTLRLYAEGRQPLAFLSAESRKALDNRLCRMSVNIPALTVSSLTERLRITGFSDPVAWHAFVANDLDQLAAQVHADALTYRQGFVLVWAKDGRPTATVESPFECAVIRDPADRSVLAGVKRYSTKRSTEAYVYLPDRVEHWTAPTPNAVVGGFRLVETIPHTLGVVPLVPFDNGRSEIEDLRDLTDALVKVTLDMVIASHAAGFGRRWVTGVELTEKPRLDAGGNRVVLDGEPVVDTTTPFDEGSRSWAIAENPETKFGSFAEAALSGFETAVRVLVSQIQAVSALPSHYLGVLTAQPSSADALRASEASLTARAESKQLLFGRSWEQVARLLVAVSTATDPAALRVQWADAATRSTAQEADAVVKLVQAGILPVSYALAKLGYSDDEVVAIRSARRADTLDGIGLDIGDDAVA
ncbi:phage portal protein [[Mycobacterium] holstebronense]|uniref:Phage portal protein n=1 Tax=[Mycobacterium] holstebronense TaxID=3064288 RepID=A0ABM9LSX6_9MYCO|nr:phage portal protein [Mycolicibacter sp. MU0102]CAJ1504154.1 phage portal protein [Mycolicibacter sp. MU0102]